MDYKLENELSKNIQGCAIEVHKKHGLILFLNFYLTTLKNGIKRVINNSTSKKELTKLGLLINFNIKLLKKGGQKSVGWSSINIELFAFFLVVFKHFL